MKFEEIEEQEFSNFLDRHPLKTFLQTPEISKLRKHLGWNTYFVAVKRNDEIIAASFICSHLSHFGQYEFYAPRGLLVDYKDKEVLTFFVKKLKKFIKMHKGYILRIDPYYITKTRDINGDIVEGKTDNTLGINNLVEHGFKKSASNEQVSWTFSLDLDKTEEELLKDMRSFTRRNIQKAIKNKIVVRDAKYEELELVKQLLDATCERKHFSNRNLSYFQEMYKLFMPKNLIKFVIAEIDTKKVIESLNNEKKECEEIISRMEKQGSKEEKISKHREKLGKIEKEIESINLLKEEKGDIIPASVGIFINYGDEVLYLFGGNKKEYMHFGAPYLIQWEMIKFGLENNFRKYNFYGISGNFDKNDKDYGIYDFKKGFTGYVEELIGEYELPINGFYYNLFKFIHRIKK